MKIADLAKLINPAVLHGRPPQNMMRSYQGSPRNDEGFFDTAES